VLLATVYGPPIAPYVLDKICLVDQLWNEGEKVLAHIHLALARLPTVILVIAPARSLVFHVLEFATAPFL
jgi:hypothetical protein